ncbi:unnamed protein product [Anisakis simplex]|uniref:Atrial natriuretic peptide receptor 3 (inferred by orthology to a human protein) n=1 Tax=Anisakis simplex TaxID=6269 RepID=A0A158PNF8_ANISI|nr:unnamed protein product [Anisakis simplex]
MRWVQYRYMLMFSAALLSSALLANATTPSTALLFPIDIVVGLPLHEGSTLRNPFRLTIAKSQPVFDVAVGDIYFTHRLLPEDSLRITYVDTNLSDAIGPQRIIERYCARSVDAVMGISYVYALAPVARMSQFWQNGVPVFTTSAMVDELGNKEHYPLLTRLMGTYKTVAQLVLILVNRLYWRRFHFFFHDEAARRNVLGLFAEIFVFNIFDPNLCSEALQRNEFFSVIILCASPDTVREIMLAAYDLGMATSGEYVFINIDVSTGSHAEKPWIRANETNSPENEKAKHAYRALKTISLRRSDLDEYKNFESRVKERAEKKYNYSAKTGKEYEMNNFISAFYDAVLLYAIALNETITEGLDPRNGRNITSKMWSRTFVGITGNVSIDENGDRYSDYSLLDLDPSQEKFVEVAYYSGASNELKQVTEFHWVGGSPPKDSPICGWDHSKCPEGYPVYVYLLLGSFMFIFFASEMIMIMSHWRRYRLEAELAAMSWKIRWEDLNGDENRKEKKKNKRSRKVHGYQYESEALLRSNSRSSLASDKVSSLCFLLQTVQLLLLKKSCIGPCIYCLLKVIIALSIDELL